MDLEKKPKDPNQSPPFSPPPASPPPPIQQNYSNQQNQNSGNGPMLSEAEAKQWATFAHLGFVIGGFLVPLIIWLINKDKSDFVDKHGKEALNFQLSILIYVIGGAILMIVFIGIFVILAAVILNVVFSIMALVAANKGEHYRYPMTIRMIS